MLLPLLLAGLVLAMLRLRLDEIDAAVRRSLVQLVVVALVGAVFLAASGVVGRASDTSFGSMVAGGVVALLLVPVAVAVRRAVITVVYGDRDFPYRVVSDLRSLDPTAPPEDALRETLQVLARSLRLSFASIEVDAGPGADRISTSIGEPRGQQTAVDLSAGGTALGVLRLEVDPSRDPFGPRDRRLLEDVGSQVGALVQAVTLNRELQRSREHLVAAREEERRRVRRDLHDGLGPSLAGMAMNLDVAHELIRTDPDGAADLVGRLADQAQRDIGEVRRLVDGLRPPALDQLGLVAALRQRADDHNLTAARGGPDAMTWSVRADGDLDGLPAAVEVAAYRIVVEAVNNAQRHSRAGDCSVTVRRASGRCSSTSTTREPGCPTTPAAASASRPCAIGPRSSAAAARSRHRTVAGRRSGSGCRWSRRTRARGRPWTPSASSSSTTTTTSVAGCRPCSTRPRTSRSSASRRTVRRPCRCALDLQPDVVLMDLHMPLLNGIEATERIVRSSPHIGVLVVTMMEDEESVFAAVRAGARGYLLKGARRPEIVRSIEAVGAGEVIFGPGIAERMMTYFKGVHSKPAPDPSPS